MPVIFFMILGIVYLGSKLFDSIGRNTQPFDPEWSEIAMKATLGKSPEEQKRIMNDFNKRR